jgi:hypothetical protein
MNFETLLERPGLYNTKYPTGHSFTYRLLSLREYGAFRTLRDSGVLDEWTVCLQVFKLCYQGDYQLVPYLNLPLGMLVSIGQLIMHLSGDASTVTMVEDIRVARQELAAQGLLGHMKKVIYTAFPSYTPELLLVDSYPDLIRKFVLAEDILVWRSNGDFKPLEFSPLKEQSKDDGLTVVTTGHVQASQAGEDNFAKLEKKLDKASARKLDVLKKRR